MPSKEEEAAALMKSAKKHTTKTLTKWTLDWDDGASDYEKAAKIYSHIGQLKQAREAYNLSSMCHEKAGNLYHAGKVLEGLADFLKDQDGFTKTPEGAAECTDLYCRASRLYALDRKPDRQAEALARAARVAPASNNADAVKYILEGIDALEDNEKFHLTPDLYRAAILILVRANRLVDAIQTLKKEINAFSKLNQDANGAKAGLEIIVLALVLGDWVIADRYFRELTTGFGFPHTKEQALAYDLLSAVEERDEERLKEALGSQTLSFLIPDIARLAKTIKIGGTNAPTKARATVGGITSNVVLPTSDGAAGGGGAAAAAADDDDEDLK